MLTTLSRRATAILAATAVASVGAVVGVALGPTGASAGAASMAVATPPPDPARPGGPLDPAHCSTPSETMLPGVPWTQTRLAPARVWPMTTGRGVVVAVIDTGVDGSVPQLSGHVLPGIDVITGVGRADSDCYGHGTFVAGIIAAAPRSGTGVAGIAPGVTILPIRQANGPQDGTSSGLARSIRAAVDAGARTVNISASAFAASQELRSAVEYAEAHDVVLVASASNEAERGNPKAYPASFPEVVGVGAVGPDGKRTSFSEIGASVDLVAPGTNIVSLSRGGPGHLTDNGTSYSTPFVTAVVALVRAYHPGLSAAAVRHRLEVTADHPAGALPDVQVGWGIVNPYRAVTAILPEEAGATPRGSPLPAVPAFHPSVVSNPGRSAALAVAAVSTVGILVAFVLGSALPRGARRRWRPAGAANPAPVKESPSDKLVGRPL